MSKLSDEAYELYRTIWSNKLAKEEPQPVSAPLTPLPHRNRTPGNLPSERHITKAG